MQVQLPDNKYILGLAFALGMFGGGGVGTVLQLPSSGAIESVQGLSEDIKELKADFKSFKETDFATLSSQLLQVTTKVARMRGELDAQKGK